MLRHVNVGRKNGDEHCDESDSRKFTRDGDEDADSAGNLGDTADYDQQRGIR